MGSGCTKSQVASAPIKINIFLHLAVLDLNPPQAEVQEVPEEQQGAEVEEPGTSVDGKRGEREAQCTVTFKLA